jgi:hypothetical protein
LVISSNRINLQDSSDLTQLRHLLWRFRSGGCSYLVLQKAFRDLADTYLHRRDSLRGHEQAMREFDPSLLTKVEELIVFIVQYRDRPSETERLLDAMESVHDLLSIMEQLMSTLECIDQCNSIHLRLVALAGNKSFQELSTMRELNAVRDRINSLLSGKELDQTEQLAVYLFHRLQSIAAQSDDQIRLEQIRVKLAELRTYAVEGIYDPHALYLINRVERIVKDGWVDLGERLLSDLQTELLGWRRMTEEESTEMITRLECLCRKAKAVGRSLAAIGVVATTHTPQA